jgi:hypothetical protein
LLVASPCKKGPEHQNDKNLKLGEFNTQIIKSGAVKFNNNRQRSNKTLNRDELPK